MSTKIPTVGMVIRIPTKLHEKVRKTAYLNRRSINKTVILMIRKWYQKNESDITPVVDQVIELLEGLRRET